MQELPATGSRIARALAFVRPHRTAAAAIIALTLMGGALGAIDPLLVKKLFDALGGTSAPLAPALLGLAALALGREVATAAGTWLTWRTRLAVHFRLLDATVTRLHKLPLQFHRAEGVGAVMTRLDRGIQGFVSAITDLAFLALPAIVYLGASAVLMWRLEPRLAILMLAFAPLPAIVSAWAAPRQARRERRLLEKWAKIYSRFNEVLAGIVTVKSFAMEEEEKRRFLGGVERANHEVIRGVGFDAGATTVQSLATQGARIAALGVGALLVQRGGASTGTLVAFLAYLGGLFAPVQGLAGLYKTVRTASVSLDTVFDILDAQDHLGDAPDARDPHPVRGHVRFEHVRFHYPTDELPLLDEIDLDVAPGELVAIVGPSGAGKSTLMSLLQRFYDPVEGRILVDGQDLRALRQRALRKNIGVVLQDALLFNESVRDNIAYGRPDATESLIHAAARAANAEPFITRLPDGYDTLVGERGSRLSGGERQRIAIARALLKDPPILILDEATSALDAETEALVQEALERLTRGRTTFVIAHRLSTVVRADRIVVLRRGRIVEQGTHRQLLAANGYYASLVRRQTRGLLDDESQAA